MKKIWAFVLCGLLVISTLAGCGKTESKEIELSWENIGEYLNIDISYSKLSENTVVGNSIMLEETIKIYPVKGGSFNNVELVLVPSYAQEGWELISPSSTYVQCRDEDAVLYEFSIVKITLPSDGNYECTHKFKGYAWSELPQSYTYEWSESKATVNEYWVKAFGDFVEMGEPAIIGTFKEN